MDIFQRLGQIKLAAEFRAAREELAKLVSETDDALETLKQRLIDAQFSASPNDRRQIKEEIKVKEDLLQDLDAALLGLPDRIKAAEANESRAELSALHAAAKKDQRRLHALFIEMDDKAAALAPVILQIRELDKSLSRANARFNDCRRPDLLLEHPIQLLKAHTGRLEAEWPSELKGYTAAHSDGPIFNRMKEIKV